MSLTLYLAIAGWGSLMAILLGIWTDVRQSKHLWADQGTKQDYWERYERYLREKKGWTEGEIKLAMKKVRPNG